MADERQGRAARMGKTATVAGVGLVLVLGVMSCHKSPAQSGTAAAANAADPADANFAPVNGQPAQVLGQTAVNESQQQGEDYTPGQQPPAPIERQAPEGDAGGDQAGPPPGYDQAQGDQGYDQGDQDDAQAEAIYQADLTSEEATEPPPELPEYDQPPCPDPNYIWTPGYWAWGPAGYYWVPGVWVAAPYEGALWTPGYWGFIGSTYRWHHGFWGRHIGFYGGIDYGFGYVGHGYYGGYWNNGHFFYNTAVNRVDRNRIRNVYVHNVVVNNRVVNNQIFNRVSYRGGRGGLQARPLPAEVAVMHEQRVGPMQSQLVVRQQAQQNRAQFFQQNHGRPAQATLTRAVGADRTLPAALPRVNAPANGFRGNPGAANGRAQPGQPQPHTFGPEVQRGAPGQPNHGVQGQPNAPRQPNVPGQPNNAARPEHNQQPGQTRQEYRGQAGQPQNQPQQNHAQPNAAQPQAQRPVQDQGRFQNRGGAQNGAQPVRPENARPQPQPQARPQYQPQVRPQAQPQPQARSEYQRPQAQPQSRPEVQRPQQRPAAPPQRAQPQHQQPRPAPQARPEPSREDHPGR